MRQKRSIDVIVPCYRYGRFLAQCVDSVLNEQERAVRVLIIDDASPDETPDVAAKLARKDSRVSWRRHPANRGHIATYNEGIEWVAADYMLLLSADDFITPGALARAAELLDTHPDIVLTYGPVVVLREDSPWPPELDDPAAPGWRIMDGQEFLWQNRLAWRAERIETSAAVVRTSVQKQIGGYRPELPHTGDFEMWLRFAARGPIGRLNATQGIYRKHRRNMSSSYYYNLMDDMRQRIAAVDAFINENASLISGPERLYRHLIHELALLSVDYASDMFVEGKVRAFDDLLEVAVTLDPDVRRRLAWRKQQLKRLLGPRVWSALKPRWRPLPAAGDQT